MADRLERLMHCLQEQIDLQPVELAPDLAASAGPDRGISIKSFNWHSDRFRKVTVMETSVEVPPMHQLNSILYPCLDYDLPIFLFLTVVLKSHVIAIYNVNCPFSDAASVATYVDPLIPVYERYAPFDGKERLPDWFEKYRTPATIFGLYSMDELDDLVNCALEYLGTYLKMTRNAGKVEDAERLTQIGKFHEQFKEDIRTKDRGRWVLAKLMSDDYARRVFYEVAT